MNEQQLLDILIQQYAFAGAAEEDLARLAQHFEIEEVEDQHVFFAEGQVHVSDIYIIMSGMIVVSRHIHNANSILFHLKPGDMLGLVGFLNNAPRIATCTAIDKVVVGKLAAEKYRQLADSDASLALILQRAISLQLSNDFVKAPILFQANMAYNRKLITEEDYRVTADISRSIENDRLPEQSASSFLAYKMIDDQLNLDASPMLNLASFTNSWMEEQASKLAIDNLGKNFIDLHEYKQTEIIHNHVVNIIANLFHGQYSTADGLIGTCTVGSSEAIMLALLAHKVNWRNQHPDGGKPNLVLSAANHSCWFKFTRYFDVEARIVPVNETNLSMSAEQVKAYIDENTIAVGCVCGSTLLGRMDELQAINDMLVELKAEQGLDIPMHVDAASAGFILPFTHPDLPWDFRLSQVKSINVSNSKYGLVYPAMGTVVFKDPEVVPQELIFKIDYLGGEMENYSLNFSKNSNVILLQYYNFIRLGYAGYSRIMLSTMESTNYLVDKLNQLHIFDVLSDTDHFPIIVVKSRQEDQYPVANIAKALLARGWQVPNYQLVNDMTATTVLRMVIRESFDKHMVDLLYEDLVKICKEMGILPPR